MAEIYLSIHMYIKSMCPKFEGIFILYRLCCRLGCRLSCRLGCRLGSRHYLILMSAAESAVESAAESAAMYEAKRNCKPENNNFHLCIRHKNVYGIFNL